MEMIRGRTRPIEMAKAGLIQPTKAEAKLDLNIHNRFDIEVIDATTGKTKQKAYAENVICDQLWTRMFHSTSANREWNKYIHYGSGTGTPSASDTSLFTFVGSSANTNTTRNFDTANGVASARHQIRLSETTAVGVTITEVGIGYSTSATSLCTHAMLKDMNGNQISIAKTNTDIINIFATVFVHYNPEGYDSGTIRIAPHIDNFLTEWLFGLKDFIGYAGAGQGGWMSTSVTNNGTSTWSFTLNSTNRTAKFAIGRRDVSTWNLSGGIKCINYCGVSGSTQYLGFKVGGSWYPGTSIVGESIATGDGVTKDFKTDFGEISDATIYVDGVPVSNVVVDESPFLTNQAGNYFENLDENGRVSSTTFVLGSSGTIASSATRTFFNPYYPLGMQSFTKTAPVKVEVSDDFVTWTEILTGQSGTVTVPSEYRQYKYWRFTNTSTNSQNLRDFVIWPTNNIHFETAPASGAVITADYFTKAIAKDINHVFDFEFTITVGEKTV